MWDEVIEIECIVNVSGRLSDGPGSHQQRESGAVPRLCHRSQDAPHDDQTGEDLHRCLDRIRWNESDDTVKHFNRLQCLEECQSAGDGVPCLTPGAFPCLLCVTQEQDESI